MAWKASLKISFGEGCWRLQERLVRCGSPIEVETANLDAVHADDVVQALPRDLACLTRTTPPRHLAEEAVETVQGMAVDKHFLHMLLELRRESSVSPLAAKRKQNTKIESKQKLMAPCGELNMLSSDSEDAYVWKLTALQVVVCMDVSEGVRVTQIVCKVETLRSCLVSKVRGARLVSCPQSTTFAQQCLAGGDVVKLTLTKEIEE